MNASLGIDPGISGAVALLRPEDQVRFWDTPSIKSGGKREYDAVGMHVILVQADMALDDIIGLRLHAYVERSQAMPKQGPTGMFNYGKGYGLWLGLLIGLGIPYTLVSPRTWRKVMMPDMAKDKGASLLRAKQLFPQCAAQLQLVKDHDKAEALLIAAWGQRQTPS